LAGLDVAARDAQAVEVLDDVERVLAVPLEQVQARPPGGGRRLGGGRLAGGLERQRGLPADGGRAVGQLGGLPVPRRPQAVGLGVGARVLGVVAGDLEHRRRALPVRPHQRRDRGRLRAEAADDGQAAVEDVPGAGVERVDHRLRRRGGQLLLGLVEVGQLLRRARGAGGGVFGGGVEDEALQRGWRPVGGGGQLQPR
jgi:hypothetical protein